MNAKTSWLAIVAVLIGAPACSGGIDTTPSANEGSSTLEVNSKKKPKDCDKHPNKKQCQQEQSNSIAILWGQIPPLPTSGSGGSGGFPEIDPLRMQVFISNSPLSCGDPFGGLDCNEWRVGSGLPPELQVPGTLQLDDPRLNSLVSESWPNIDAPSSCWYGSGGPAPGTVEIREVTDSHLVIALTGVGSPYFDATGVYTVARCP